MNNTATNSTDLHTGLHTLLPAERILTRLIDRVSYAADAGFYHLQPRAVVRPINEQEIIALFGLSHRTGIPLVFRTGGTSLSGQSITDGILVDLSQHWKKISIQEEGRSVRVQPGITGAMVNAYLKKYHSKIGPDPSSISAAMMGGILSNNASGMCCGVAHNSYHTTRSIRFILPDGQTFSTEEPTDYDRFLATGPLLAQELTTLREEIRNNSELYEKIRSKYTMKNTVGYSLNAFIDYEHPLDIFAHLLIGGEGTLAFIAEAVLDTVPDPPQKATALLYFPDTYGACKAIPLLKKQGAAMVELMDKASLRAVEDMPGIDPFIKGLPAAAAALLIEFQAENLQQIQITVDGFLAEVATLPLINAPIFHTEEKQRDFLWRLRKGLFPAVGAVRASGTTVILEDLSFPVETLGDAILDLQQLFAKYNYDNAIIFGHAKDGNIHFVITQSLGSEKEIDRYDRFLREVVDLVVHKYNGALKAEHGTGRNMAPFVETEWGGEAYRIMQRIKTAADPQNLLNPGVIINTDKEVHIKDLKQLPAVEEEVDKCIECGYCEPVCPSRELTLTPRRRIVVRRALVKMEAEGDKAGKQTLLEQYQYDGLETCAVDGLCAGACPVYINTGDLVKRLRRENHSRTANRIALWTAKHFAVVEIAIRIALRTGAGINKLLGRKTMTRFTKGIKKIIPGLPLWSDQLAAPPSLSILKQHPALGTSPNIIYFPTCISRVLGNQAPGQGTMMQAFLDISAKAGINVRIMDGIKGSCCGQIYGSKGFTQAYQHTANKIVTTLWTSSNHGALPIVTDTSSCAHTLYHLRPALTVENQQKFDALTLMDSLDYIDQHILPASTNPIKKEKIILHPVCSLQKTGNTERFKKIAAHFAKQVVVPINAGCCGMAGDRGFLFPELTQSATHAEASEAKAIPADGYYSSTRTCEMAMTEAVGKNYESILALVNECMTPTIFTPHNPSSART